MSGSVDPSAFVTGFLAEAHEILAGANTGLLALDKALERQKPTLRIVRELFRLVHTLKGLAAMIGVEPIVAIAHAMETVLRGADRGERPPAKEGVTVLLRSVAALRTRVAELEQKTAVQPAPPELIAALVALAEATSPLPSVPVVPALRPEVASKLSAGDREQLAAGLAAGERAVEAAFLPSAARAEEGITITSVRQSVQAIAEIVKVLPTTLPKTPESAGGLCFVLLLLTTQTDAGILAACPALEPTLLTVGVGTPPPRAAGLPSGEEPTTPVGPASALAKEPEPADRPEDRGQQGRHVRVGIDRLDDALGTLSALIVNRFRLGHALDAIAARGVDVRELREVLQDNGRILRDMRAAIVRLRMIRVQEMLEPLALLVRGLRSSTQKAVRLEIEAGNTELDKAVAERVWPAIVHLVRNAVDHGIEQADARIRLGKPAEGVLRVRCETFSTSRLIIRIEDDGGGIDVAALARRANVPTPDDADALLSLICRPGLSSKDEASATSGRGMGMDIVWQTIVGALGGDLAVDHRAHEGTTFVLTVPLTVTIVDCLRFVCADRSYVVPVAAIDEVLTLDDGAVASVPGGRGGEAVRILSWRGESMALFDLGSLLGHPPARREKALVVRRQGAVLAFAVDRMMGKQEVVVRPLVDPLVQTPGVAGSTDLGDGKPTLVLDLLALTAPGGAA